MTSFEKNFQDPTIQAIHDVMGTMESGAAPGELGPINAQAPNLGEMRAMQVEEFGPYRRPFDTYSGLTNAEKKAAGAVFYEGLSDILTENDAAHDKMSGGRELRCRGTINGQQRQVVIAQTKEGTHVVFTTDTTGSKERYSYILGSKGEVRRVDRKTRTEDEQEMSRRIGNETRTTLQSTPQEKATAVLAMIREARQFHEQLILEARMGTNNLPVGQEEITQMLEDVRNIVKNRVPQA